jgi:formyltetrahydrofolate-dependent phosphoribosylglycinamide formyltransferase|tara:strand:+ start:211 stop:774 length:564 start_codon:yes stop_codon:yes gene_type:complete
VVKKIKTCVFVSGNGSNLNAIIKSSKKKSFPIEIVLILSNNNKSNVIKLAKKNSIIYKYYSSKNKNKFEKKSLSIIKKNKIEFICLAGFMKKLSLKFIKSFGYKIINIHPSLLPKYKGLNTHERVLKNNEKYSGCSVHYVDKNLDSGKVIMKKKVLIVKNENVKSLQKKILKQEHILYSKSILSIFK